QEEKDDDDDDDDSFGQRLQDFADGLAYSTRGVKRHHVFQAGRKAFGEPLHFGAHIAIHVERVGVGKLKHAHAHGVDIVVTQLAPVAFGAEFGAAYISQLNQRSVAGPLDHDAIELFRVCQPAHCTHADFVSLAGGRWLLAYGSGGDLHVLFAQRTHHVRSSKVARRQLDWIQPQAHGILAFAEDHHVTHALHALQRVANVDIQVVADEQIVI